MISQRDALASSVRAELARGRMSGRTLAKHLKVSHAYVARRLSGDVPFKADELVLVAALLNIPVGRFYEIPETQPANGIAS